MSFQENCGNSGRKFLFGGISLLQPSEIDASPPIHTEPKMHLTRESSDSRSHSVLIDASPPIHTERKMHLTRENSDSRSHSVFRKNSQKRRSPSFRSPPCEREMMKNLRFKKSTLYSSTPDLCRPGAFPKSLHGGDCGVGRPSVKQMIQNFEVVGSTVGNPDDRVVLSKVVDNSTRKTRTLPLNSFLPSRSSSERSSYLSNSFDTGFYSDSSCCDFEGTPKAKKNGPGTIFDSSTSLCLLPTTLSSIYGLHQDNPLYGSLPRIKPTVTSRNSDYSRPAISSCVKESVVQLRRTRSINCESSEHMIFSKSESCVTKKRAADSGSRAFIETHCKSVRATESVSSVQYRGRTDEESSSSPQNGELCRRRNTTKRNEIPGKTSTEQTNGTFIARWVQVDDLNKDANADDDSSSINSTSTSNSQSSDSKLKGGRASGSKRDKRPERRESSRFTSAAKLLRSLSRAPREEPSDTLQRSNPHYHSEGKGLRKKNAWTSQRELSSSSTVHKERSHSFCDKAESKVRRSSSSQEGKEYRASSSNEQNFVGIGARVAADTRNSSVMTSESGPTRPPSSGELELEESRPQERVLERDKDRRSVRKLTKDSGYETSPYSELSDYAHLEQLVADAASDHGDVESEDDGDDVTLAAESEPTSEVTPSTSPTANTPTLSRRNSRDKSTASRATSLPGSDSLLSGTLLPPAATERLLQQSPHPLLHSPSSPTLIPNSSLRPRSPRSRPESPHQLEGFHLSALPSSSALPRCPSLSSLSSFAESLVNSPGRPTNTSISNLSLLLENPSPTDHPSSSQHQHSHGNTNQPHTHSQQQQVLLLPASSTSSQEQQQKRQHAQSPRPSLAAKNTSLVPGSLTRSTPNLDETEDGNMVTKNSPMYSYMRNGSASAAKGSSSKSSKMKSGRYWEGSNSSDNTDREDYAHHLRSSSYQVLHSQQQLNMGPSGPHHARQASNASHCSEPEDGGLRSDLRAANYSTQFYGPPNVERSRYLSYDNIGPETSGHKYQTSWNVSEPNLSGTPPHSSQNSYYPPPHHLTTSHNSHSGYYHHHSEASNSLHSSPGVHHTSLNMQHSASNLHSSNNSQQQPPPPPVRQSPPAPRRKHPSSPPPLPVRDASSLKFLKYGPGHEKFPSWPVPAGNASQVMGSVSEHDSNASGLAESLTGPQGSHRSKSWTEQSDFPKDLSGGYTRPHHKKHLSPAYQQQLKTVLEKSEKILPQLFESKLGDDLLSDPKCVLLDSIYKPDSSYYPLYDRDGHGIDDKDYNIPSPPERDPGMGEANLSQVTPAQLEEYSRHYDFSYGDVGVTPFLDRLREESAAWDGSSAAWDGGSERDSGRGESESMADSFRYSNGRESVTTVVTNSSSASSSETLKWHGSLSDISIMSGHSRDARTEQNIVHSSRVLAPQRQNSESVLYYVSDKGRKQCRGLPDYRTRDGARTSRENDPTFARGSRETRWNREVERNNEMNNLKKFPSYSYTQPLSQINEAPGAESHETIGSNQSTKSPTIDISKPPSVAERIHELERQSRNPQRDQSQRFRDASEPRERTGSRDGPSLREVRRRDLSEPRGEFRDEQENTQESRGSYNVDLSRSATESNQSHFNSEALEQRPDLTGDRSQSTIGISNELNLSSKPVSKAPIRNAADLPAQDQENLHSQFNHDEREKIAPLKNFAYLDPKKQCKVPDSTLKNIQKQALMSFYERRTGIKSTSASSLGSNKPPSPLVSKNSFSSSRSGSNIREDRSGLAGISLARLGRVPDSDCAESPSRPPRKRSVSGRSDLKEDGSLRPGGDSQRSSLVSNGSGSTTDAAQSSLGVYRQTSLPLPPAASPEPPPVPPPPALELRLGDDPPQDNSRPSNITRPPVLPPTALDEPLPRPPERPPKKANLRSLFPSQKDHGGATGASFHGEDLSKPGRPYYYRRPPAPDPPATPDEPSTPEGCLFPPAVSESTLLTPDSLLNGDLHNPSSVLSSPGHRFQRGTYSHSASLTPCHLSLPSVSQGNAAATPPLSPTIQALASQASRSSTPDLPPPPLPEVEPEASVNIDEEPLPPPPTEVIRSNSRKVCRSSEPPRSLDDLSYSMKSISSGEEASGPPSLILFTEKHLLPSASEAIETSKTFRRRSRSPPPPPTPTTPPPPLTEVDENTERQQEDDGTYHKDSYMAQKKDWKSGFEGRYRRTSSPSASPIRNSLPRGPNHPNAHSQPHNLAHHSSTKCLNTYNSSANNNHYSSLSATSMLSSSTMALTSYPSNASSSGSSSLSSSLSSSSSKSKSGSHLKHSISSTSSSSSSSAGSTAATPRQPPYNPRLKSIPLDNENNANTSCVKSAPLDNENHVNNNNHSSPNGWPGHARQTSTTVNFTSEELRAFRSRRAAGESYFQASYRTLPSAVSTPALVQPSSYNSQTTSSNQGSSSSLASATIDTPPKTSPSTSLRASLDSLHCPRAPVSSKPRGLHEVLPRTTSVNENISSGLDSMSRCLSAADSLSRSTSVAESLCRSSSVAETASSLSRASSISEPTAPSPTSLLYGALSADGQVIARPATVTEEQPMPTSSPEPRYSDLFEYSQTLTSSNETYSLTQSSFVEEPASVAQSPDIISSQSPASINDQSCATLAIALELVATLNVITDSEVELEDPLAPLLNHQELQPSFLCDTSPSSTNSIVDPPQSPPALPSVPPPPLEPPSPPSPASSDVETVTIGYGRSRRPEELECEQLSMEYVARLGLNPRLQALLAPGPELKTTADYMEGVFTYKVRRDILASQAQHLLPKSPPISSADYRDSSHVVFPTSSSHSRLESSSNSSYSRIRDTDSIFQRLHSVPRLSSHNDENTSNSSLINSNTSLSNRFTTTCSNPSTSSPLHNHDTLTSLTNSSSYSSSNVPIRPVSPRLSRSSSYLGASPAHLSSANQVANFTSLASPLRTEDGKSASSHFFASRSLSMGPEHPSAFGSSLSSLVVAEGLTNGDAGNHNLTNGESPCSSDVLRRKASDRSPLPSDSAYFTTSESKARLLTRLRSSPGDLGDNSGGSSPTSPGQADSQQTLLCKKEALMSSISRKLDILRAEREAIKEEVRLNRDLGAGVTEQVQQLAKAQEIDKYLRHVEEIDKITSLLLGLSGRLARADNALLLLSDQDGQELRKNLMIKRARLKEQLDEAKTLKENIDRRALQVDTCLKQYLNEAEFADYDHFIKMKAKLVMDAREIADKIKLGEEQMAALRETFKSAEDASANK